MRKAIEPRGPYTPSGDPSIAKGTLLLRSNEAWADLERRFGARRGLKKARPNKVLSLDPNMMAGLKTMFQDHRDYLITVTRDLGVVDIIKHNLLNPPKIAESADKT